MKLRLLIAILALFTGFSATAQCLEIESIFVDACGPTEGENEMFTFSVGATALPVNDISVAWPNNAFNGWCQNAGTAASTAALNATILSSCGVLLEPAAGQLPANATVIVITSENISLIDNSFEGLTDTVYIIYQCMGNTAGHFANGGSGTRTLTITTTNSCIGVESATYDRALLTGGDGATVVFDPAGNPTYINNGCNAPVPFVSAAWTFTNEICIDYGVVDLTSLLGPGATPGGTWSGANVTGTNFDPAGLSGMSSITYTVTGTGACPTVIDSTITFNTNSDQTVSSVQQTCDSAFIDGMWYSSDITLMVMVPPSDIYGCDSTNTITLTINSEIIDSTYLEACGSLLFNGTNYSSSTTLYDTIPGETVAASSCDELFISEYIEGSSNNKAIEIYNGTGVPVNLANYTLDRYTNGGAAVSATLNLVGTVADGDVFVVVNSNANAAFQAVADMSDGVINHNGNDAYALLNNGVIVDIFGNIGCNPGAEWTDLGNGTQNNGFYRVAGYTAGQLIDFPNTPCTFPSLNAMNWVSQDAQDITTQLGSHTANCSGGTTTLCDTVVITRIEIINTATTSSNVSLCDGDSLLVGGAFQTTAGSYADTFTIGGSGMNTVDTFYFETFDGAPSWTLNQSTGVNGADNNFWEIDANEGGVDPGGCGVANNGNSTLHITSVFLPTGGAAYDAGGFCGLLFCPETNMAASSGPISTIGRTNITFGFDYIANGDALLDNASVEYSTNGGATYAVIDPSIKSAVCGGGQGLWTAASYTLPASAENVPDVRLRFNWTNNDDGVGTDPSVAINDVYLTSSMMGGVACDSIHTTTLAFTTLIAGTTNTVDGCDSVVFNGVTYTSNTMVNDTLQNAAGCDSIYNTTTIVINSTVTSTNPASPILICATDSAQLPDGSFVSAAGMYNTLFAGASSSGCDSTVVTEVQVESCDCSLADDLTFWAKGDTLVSNLGAPVMAGMANNWGNIIANPAVPALGTTGGGTRTLIASDPDFNFNSSMDLANAGFGLNGLQNDAVLDPMQGSMFVVATQPGLSLNFVVSTAGTGTCGGNRCSSGYRGNRSEFGGANNLYNGTSIAGVANVMAMTANVGAAYNRNAINGVSAINGAGNNIPAATPTVNYGLFMGSWPGFHITGKIAEALVFDRQLTDDEFERVESYLAVKYGVTLAHNYYASDWDGTTGTTIWNTGGGYDNFVAGIGVDDCLGLEQILSHSVLPGNIVTMALTDNGGTFANPNTFDNFIEFLMWGNNNGSTTFGCDANTPAGFNMLYGREWLVEENGSIGNTSVGFDISAANIAGIGNQVALVIDTDVDGSYTDETPVSGTVTGNNLIFDNIDFVSNQTFTLVFNSDTTVMVSDSICAGTSYTLPGGAIVSAAGIYMDTLAGVNFCDSIVSTTISLLANPSTMLAVSICEGASYTLPDGTMVGSSGSYSDTTQLVNGCDSIHTIVLNVVQAQSQTLPSITICANEVATIFGSATNIAGTYIDTIQSSSGCDSVIQSIDLIVNPTATDTVMMVLCEGDSLFVGGATQTTSGLYLDTITGMLGCDLYSYTDLIFETAPTADAGMDVTINLGEETLLTATGGNTYNWSTGDFGPNALVSPTATTSYTVEVANTGGCTDTDSVTVIVIDREIRVILPTAFSPNGDGINDFFEIVNKDDFSEITMRVYNRWGELIHTGNGSNHFWDGKYKAADQPLGSYSFFISVKPVNSNEPIDAVGNVTLIR